MQQDNIKDFATAAFRFYGQALKKKINPGDFDAADFDIVLAASLTIRHLEAAKDFIAAEGIRQVYFDLPPGKLRRGVMSNTIRRAAYDMHISEGTLWNKLRHARMLFNEYYIDYK